jgi:hypothetical protein
MADFPLFCHKKRLLPAFLLQKRLTQKGCIFKLSSVGNAVPPGGGKTRAGEKLKYNWLRHIKAYHIYLQYDNRPPLRYIYQTNSRYAGSNNESTGG